MVSKVRVYVEGGGDGTATKRRCRGAFSELFKKTGRINRPPRVIACGGRGDTYKRYRTALGQNTGTHFLLLVDSERPVSQRGSPWEHLGKDPDKWVKPERASDDDVHLMVQCMEAWFFADRDTLADYYGQDFSTNALPGQQNIERISKKDIFSSLGQATRNTTEGKYHKTKHGFALLGRIDPAKVCNSSPYASRFFDRLKELCS